VAEARGDINGLRFGRNGVRVVNFLKFEICFGSRVDSHSHGPLAGEKITSHFEKYLGMSCFVGQKKNEIFKYNKDRI
ncbi:hypothetical protein G4B88_001584, partial [Cannabis sativa]